MCEAIDSTIDLKSNESEVAIMLLPNVDFDIFEDSNAK